MATSSIVKVNEKYNNNTSYGKPGCKDAVWEKASHITGKDPNKIRRDNNGNMIMYHHYGNKKSRYGWHIDHITATAKGGSGFIDNLQPLKWNDNIKKSDKIDDKREYDNEKRRLRGFCVNQNKAPEINIGDCVFARQTTTANNWALATVLEKDRKNDKVIIMWDCAKYKDDLPYDANFFQQR